MKSFVLVLSVFLSLNVMSSGREGGGGDASEERVSEIRSDILSWIQAGGAKGLYLPEDITLNEYMVKMNQLLQPKAVVVTFVEKDDLKDEELQVNVLSKPKTCRSFISQRDNRPHIICNISRFKASSDNEQYKLIHHEYAGLAYLEKNEGAASDYEISSQLSAFLHEARVTKLALARNLTRTDDPSEIIKAFHNNKVSNCEVVEVPGTYYQIWINNKFKGNYTIANSSTTNDSRDLARDLKRFLRTGICESPVGEERDTSAMVTETIKYFLSTTESNCSIAKSDGGQYYQLFIDEKFRGNYRVERVSNDEDLYDLAFILRQYVRTGICEGNL